MFVARQMSMMMITAVILWFHTFGTVAPTTCGQYSVYDNIEVKCRDFEWCLYQFYTDPRSWSDARAICEQNNKTLAHITDLSQHVYLTSLIQTSLSAIYFSPPSSVWIGLYKTNGGQPVWQDDCATLSAHYTPVTATLTDSAEICYMLDAQGRTYQGHDCKQSQPFLCKAATLDISTCYESVSTIYDVNPVNVYGYACSECVLRYGDVVNLVGYRCRVSTHCIVLTYSAGITYTKGDSKYKKAMLKTEVVNLTEPVSYITSECQSVYPTSPVELPTIEMTLAPDSVPTHTWLVTSQTYSSVSVTGTVSIVTNTVLGAALQNLSYDIKHMEPTNMSNLTTFCKQLLHYVLGNSDHVFTDLSGIVDVENQITKQMESLPAGDLDMNTTVSLYLSILNHVYNFQTKSGRRQHNQTPKLLELQDSLIRLSKLNLKLQNISKTFELNMTSVSITVGDGGALQEKYTTAYGRVILENIENLRQNLASQKLMIMVISYKENLFCRSQTPDHINIPVMTTVAFDDDGRNLSDVNFLMGFPVSSNLDTANSSLDMKFNGTHYMAAFPGGFFNSASALVSADISMMESCEIYGKYGTTSPTYKDFDFYLQTNGLISVTKYRPYNFLFSFVEGIVQLPITQTPVIIIAQCQAGENTKQGGVPYLQIHKVLSQVIEGQASCWKSSKSLQLAGGRKSEITLKSFFFGTFSASIKLIPPDEIDFQAVFLNFSEKLNDTPYVLATVLAVLIALVIATPILRKQDCIDYALWSYERLIDNKPDSTFDYYICVSTGVRSKRQMEALVYINIIGTRGETGARLLAGNNRKNFSNGTSCNFFMKSDIFLGNIKTVKIWLGGNIKSQSWYLSKIIIIDEKTRNAIQLKCNKWLSLEKGTGRSWRTLRAGKKTDNASSLSEISTRNLFDDHLWFSLLFRPRYSRFTRVQRLWSIVSLLFLSMVASAMFYDTPDDTLPFLNVGNFELGYKEIYTGLMSSIITVVPSLIITFVFSKRKVLGEKPLSISNNGDTVGSSGSLPWWSIFLAYTLLLLCIISGSFFTLLYSLEWGPSLTVKWMSSFFLGSTQSAIIIDPAKAIILAILLVCLCSEKNNRSDFYLPPTSVVDKQQEFAGQGHCNRRVADCPCDEPETRAQKKRRYTLHMDRKLNRLLRRFVFGVLYACMVLLIGTQQKVSEVYGQNKHLKNVLKPTQEVEKMEDVWQYLNKVVLQRLYPSEFSSGEIKSLNELRFIGDYYKMGPIRLRQIRVSGTCTTPSLMKKHGIACIPDYDTDTEDTNDYTEGWITTNMSASLNDYTASYRYHHNLKETPTYTGHFGTYGVGGYLVDLDVLPTKANDIVNRLRRNVWLDEQTRAFFIEACLVNRNNMIFTHIQVVFEFPSTGGIFTDTTVVSSNLYPYTHTFDYIILFLQILFSFTILVRFVLVVAKIIKTQGHSLLTMSQAIEIVHLGVSVATVVCLVLRFTSTITVLNTLRQEMGFYTSFGYVFQWDGYFSLSLGMVTFLAILDLLKHLQFNYQIFLAYKTITAFRRELFHFTIALSVLIVGFASLINLIYGPTERGFRSIISAILTLFRMTIGMIKFRNDIDVPALDIFVMFAIYALVATLAFVNLLTSSLNAHITHIKQLIRDGKTPFDWYLSRHFWNRLTGLFTVCGVARPRNRRKKDHLHDIDLHQKSEIKFDQFLSTVMLLLRDDDHERMEKENLCLILVNLRRGCRRRATPNGIQYRYSNDWSEADDMLVVEFLAEVVSCRIDVDCYTTSEADNQGLIPYGNYTDPLSMFFRINFPNRQHARALSSSTDVRGGRQSPCYVTIKVPSSHLFRRPTFLITHSGNSGDWRQHTAQQAMAWEGEVYLSASMPYCPRYILAVASDLWPGIAPAIQQNNAFEHVLSKTEDVFYIPGLHKKIVLMFPEESVSVNTVIQILLEPGDKFPILHVLARGDVSGPITVQYIGKKVLNQPPADQKPEIKILTKQGDLDWKEGVAGKRMSDKDLSVQIDCLSKGVKTSIAPYESNYALSFRGRNRRLDHEKETLLGIYQKRIQSKYWRMIGRSLGFTQDVLSEIERRKPRSLEEKACIVLGRWLKRNTEKSLFQIRDTWM